MVKILHAIGERSEPSLGNWMEKFVLPRIATHGHMWAICGYACIHCNSLNIFMNWSPTEAGLTAKPNKCVWGARSLEYLGHEIGNGLVSIPEARVKVLLREGLSHIPPKFEHIFVAVITSPPPPPPPFFCADTFDTSLLLIVYALR